MTPEMASFLSDLADVLEKHKGGLTYTINDDGILVTLGSERVNIEWPCDGEVSHIREMLPKTARPPRRPLCKRMLYGFEVVAYRLQKGDDPQKVAAHALKLKSLFERSADEPQPRHHESSKMPRVQ